MILYMIGLIDELKYGRKCEINAIIVTTFIVPVRSSETSFGSKHCKISVEFVLLSINERC